MDWVLADPSGLPRKRRNASPSGVQKPGAEKDQRVSTCGLCPSGVFAGEAKTWGNGIDAPLGWNHSACVQRAATT